MVRRTRGVMEKVWECGLMKSRDATPQEWKVEIEESLATIHQRLGRVGVRYCGSSESDLSVRETRRRRRAKARLLMMSLSVEL